ncbi:MAG: AtpZ/AtpI family protein [Patescibacteria group bacterium]
MIEQKNNQWWQRAMVIFSEVTGLIVVPIIAALYGGRTLDKIYNTEPLYTLILLSLGIVVATLSITRIASRYIAEADKEARQRKITNNVSRRNQ